MPIASGKSGLIGTLAGAGPRGASVLAGRIGRVSLSRSMAVEWDERRPFL